MKELFMKLKIVTLSNLKMILKKKNHWKINIIIKMKVEMMKKKLINRKNSKKNKKK